LSGNGTQAVPVGVSWPHTARLLKGHPVVGRGRSRESVRPFFELLGEQGCRRLWAVGMKGNPEKGFHREG
jgi:hypothetical protein